MGESRQVSGMESHSGQSSVSVPRSENDYAPTMFNRRVRANTEGCRDERHHDLWICAELPSTLLGCKKLVHTQPESLNHAGRKWFQYTIAYELNIAKYRA